MFIDEPAASPAGAVLDVGVLSAFERTAPAVDAGSLSAPRSRFGRQPFALVVDDEPVIRMDAAAMLEDVGFRTLEASNSDDALTLLLQHARKVTLLFTDVGMPGAMNGFGLARATARLFPNIGILVASGWHRPNEGDLPLGALFIDKPFSPQIVYDRLREILPNGERPAALPD